MNDDPIVMVNVDFDPGLPDEDTIRGMLFMAGISDPDPLQIATVRAGWQAALEGRNAGVPTPTRTDEMRDKHQGWHWDTKTRRWQVIDIVVPRNE